MVKKIVTLIAIFISIYATAQHPAAITANGRIQGISNQDKTVNIFKGIPFAAPPTGNLRWQAPQPAENWKGTLDCSEFKASPIQNPPQPFYAWTAEFIAKPEPLSEDCLYLNVWTPVEVAAKKLPVFVWIYGGGLSSGSANCDIYDGEEMAKQGVVFVSINYRVGVLGFMAHPELSNESASSTSGNYGFLDQVSALKWVQQNISAFGGDPNNVTIAGQSAGAVSVTAMIASPLAKGLFHKAIVQSGGLLSNSELKNMSEAEAQGVTFMQKANAASIKELREMSPYDILKISNNSGSGRFGTTKDGFLLPINLKEYFRKGLHNQTPILTGWVTGDGSFFGDNHMTVEDYRKQAEEKYGNQAEEFLSIFPVSNSDDVKVMNQKLTLLGFAGLPSHLLAGYNSSQTFLYQFDHIAPDKPDFPNYGAFHTSEVPFTLHTLHTWDRPWTKVDKDLESIISSYWVNFARTGNPNGSKLPMWKSYDSEFGNVMTLGKNTESRPAFMKKEFEFLEQNH